MHMIGPAQPEVSIGDRAVCKCWICIHLQSHRTRLVDNEPYAVNRIRTMAMTTLSVRLEVSEINRLDQIAQALAARAHGARITRSNALRVTVEAGLTALEAEHDLGQKKRRATRK